MIAAVLLEACVVAFVAGAHVGLVLERHTRLIADQVGALRSPDLLGSVGAGNYAATIGGLS